MRIVMVAKHMPQARKRNVAEYAPVKSTIQPPIRGKSPPPRPPARVRNPKRVVLYRLPK